MNIPVYVVCAHRVEQHRFMLYMEIMAVFTNEEDAYRYIDHYQNTDRNLVIYVSVLNPDTHGLYPFQNS